MAERKDDGPYYPATIAKDPGQTMLKRIDPGEVELGMFIHKFEGSWFRHPFWKARFLLDDEGKLERLRHSDLAGIVIDTARGRDPHSGPHSGSHSGAPAPGPPMLTLPPGPLQRGARRAAAAAARARTEAELREVTPRTMAREFGLATRVAERSLRTISRVFLEARLGKVIEPSTIEPVVEEIFASIQRNADAFNGLMRCKRDTESVYRHVLAVCALMISLGRTLKLDPDQIRLAGMAGLLLDLGIAHLGLPDDHSGDIRELDPDLLYAHVTIGHEILVAGGAPVEVMDACLHHHERMDGTGYPYELPGEVLSLLGRMAAICDTYDWLVDDTGGHAALDPAAAIERLAAPDSGLDPELVARFTETIGIHPIGSVVELESGRLAMVIAQDECDPMRPRVRTFWSVAEQKPVPPSDIALARCFGEDRIVGQADPADLIDDFAPLRERLFEAGAYAEG